MTFDFRSRRFDSRGLSPPTDDCAAELPPGLDALLRSVYEELKSNAAGREFDVALDQIVAEGRPICRRCGAIVCSRGTIVSKRPFRDGWDF
jgi:hypothetical protein